MQVHHQPKQCIFDLLIGAHGKTLLARNRDFASLCDKHAAIVEEIDLRLRNDNRLAEAGEAKSEAATLRAVARALRYISRLEAPIFKDSFRPPFLRRRGMWAWMCEKLGMGRRA